MAKIINPDVPRRRGELAEAFRSAKFFPHLAIDDFFTREVCDRLAADFPTFRAEDAMNELGEVGPKACTEDVRALGESFRELDDFLQTAEFLGLMSDITGIPNLLYDPEYVGGGTHNNVDGAELDIHIDFNYHPKRRWHRRLNLIVFLSPEWDPDWGGNFEVHKNPWNPEQDELEFFPPQLNRAVLFETNEASWHGFNRIALPPEKQHLSRRSFALYLYTEERPDDEVAPSHATFYVQRPLPAHLTSGHTLTDADARTLELFVARRNQHMQFLYEREKEFSEHQAFLEHLVDGRRALEALLNQRVPLKGYAHQLGEASGVWSDLCIGERFELRFVSDRQVTGVRLDGHVYDFFPPSRTLTAEIGGTTAELELVHGRFDWEIPVEIAGGSETAIVLRCSETLNQAAAGLGEDTRDLAFQLLAVTCLHGDPPKITAPALDAPPGAEKAEDLATDSDARPCPACGRRPWAADRIDALEVNHISCDALERQSYDLTECAACGLIYISPLPSPEDIHSMYAESDQFREDTPESPYRGERGTAVLEYITSRLVSMTQHMPGIEKLRVLEVGAGLSWMCRAAKILGWQNLTVAQDLSSEAIEECRWVDHYVVEDIQTGRSVDPFGPFDVISMTHVFEHLADPVGMLRRLGQLLAPSGILFITAPRRPVGWQRDAPIALWRDWSYNHTPAHIQYFTGDSFARAAEAADLRVALWDDSHEDGQAFEGWLTRPVG